MKLIKYKVDIVSILLVTFIIFISLLPIYKSLNIMSLILIGIVLLFVKPITSLVQHNHVHFNIFNSKIFNFTFELLLAISTGHICSEWFLHHNVGHHGNKINSLEDTSSVKHPKTREYMTKWQYIISGSLKIYPDCLKMALKLYKKGKRKFIKVMIFETVFAISVYTYFLIINWKMTILFLIIPNIINRSLTWLGAYWHHFEVPSNDIYDSCNMFEGKFFNFISLNIGYHIAHHEKPTLHWTKLPERTKEIMSKIPSKHILAKLP